MQLSDPSPLSSLSLVSFEHQRSFSLALSPSYHAVPFPEKEIAVISLSFFKNHFASKHVRAKKLKESLSERDSQGLRTSAKGDLFLSRHSTRLDVPLNPPANWSSRQSPLILSSPSLPSSLSHNNLYAAGSMEFHTYTRHEGETNK